MGGPSPPQSPQESACRSANTSSLSNTQGIATGRGTPQIESVSTDLCDSLQLLSQQLRVEVEHSFQRYELGIRRVLEQARGVDIVAEAPAQSKIQPVSDTARDRNTGAGFSKTTTFTGKNPTIHNFDVDEHFEQLRLTAPCMRQLPKQKLQAAIRATDATVSDVPSASHNDSSRRLRQAKTKKFEDTMHFDGVVVDYMERNSKHSIFFQKVPTFRFQAGPIVSRDSLLYRLTQMAAFKAMRAAFLVVDAIFVIVGLQRSAELVAATRNQKDFFTATSSIFCFFFWFDLLLALMMEFPHVDLFRGPTGFRSVNVLTILQQTLELIGVHAAPEKRFTSAYRYTIGLFIFLRILRPMLMLPEMAGRRLQKTMGELHVMIRVLTGTLQPLLWCTLLCMFIILIFSVMFADAAAAYLVRAPLTMAETDTDFMLATAWGTVDRASYSLFTATFSGQDWASLYDALGSLAWPFKFCFYFFICFTYIALLNTVTAVFIKCAFMRLEQDRDFVVKQKLDEKRDYLRVTKHMFRLLDEDARGVIAFSDFTERMQDHEFCAYFSRLGIDTSELEKLFILMDEDGSGSLSEEEFMLGCLRLKGDATSLDVEILRQDVRFVVSTVIKNCGQLDKLHKCLNRLGPMQAEQKQPRELSTDGSSLQEKPQSHGTAVL